MSCECNSFLPFFLPLFSKEDSISRPSFDLWMVCLWLIFSCNIHSTLVLASFTETEYASLSPHPLPSCIFLIRSYQESKPVIFCVCVYRRGSLPLPSTFPGISSCVSDRQLRFVTKENCHVNILLVIHFSWWTEKRPFVYSSIWYRVLFDVNVLRNHWVAVLWTRLFLRGESHDKSWSVTNQ